VRCRRQPCAPGKGAGKDPHLDAGRARGRVLQQRPTPLLRKLLLLLLPPSRRGRLAARGGRCWLAAGLLWLGRLRLGSLRVCSGVHTVYCCCCAVGRPSSSDRSPPTSPHHQRLSLFMAGLATALLTERTSTILQSGGHPVKPQSAATIRGRARLLCTSGEPTRHLRGLSTPWPDTSPSTRSSREAI
jgi:hypothetical protein